MLSIFEKPVPVNKIITALSDMRINIIRDEFELQAIISNCLDHANIPYSREYKLAPRNRIDFMVVGGTGIEVKKGKPYSRQVINQLERYTIFPEIKAIILVVERNLDIPRVINGKMCYSFGLNKLWGIAL